MIYEKQAGVPKFECFEYEKKIKDYVVLIRIINEGERIIKELKRAYKSNISDYADIVICDGGSTDGCTEEQRLRKDFGNDYENYVKNTNRFLPKLR